MKEDIIDILRTYFNSLDGEIDLACSNPVRSVECMRIRSEAEQKLRYLILTDNDVRLISEAEKLSRSGRMAGLEKLASRCDTTTASDYINRLNPNSDTEDVCFA